MTCRAQAALWMLCVIAALAIAPWLSGSPAALRQFQARTDALRALADPRATRTASSFADTARRRLPETGGDQIVAARALPGGASLERAFGRWVAWWRIVIVRLQWLAGAVLVGLPLVAAGAIDGIAMRRGRQRERAAGSPVAGALASHALVALVLAPLLWCVLPLPACGGGMALWLVAITAALAFTLSNAPGFDAR
jgi:hypothetical protein